MVYAADLKSVSPCGIKGSSPFRSTVYVVELGIHTRLWPWVLMDKCGFDPRHTPDGSKSRQMLSDT